MLSIIRANLLRRKMRNGVTAAGVAVAVAALFSVLAFQRGYQDGLRGELDRLGAHVLVVPKGCPYDAASIALHGASWPCYLKDDYVDTVRTTPHVSVAAPVFMSAVYDPATGAQTVYCGVDDSIRGLKRHWRVDGEWPAASGQVLVGSELANDRRWKRGDRVVLPGLESRTATVAGILAPTQGADDLFIYMPLADAQQVFRRPHELTHMLVRLDAPENMEAAVNVLRGCGAGLEMNVVPLAHLFNTIQSLVQGTRLLLGAVALVALLAAGAGLSNTILMAVTERTREIGVLRAIGASRGEVFRLIWSETIALCLIGGMAGVALAVAGSRGVEAWLRGRLPFAPHGTLVNADVGVGLACLAGAVFVGTLAGLLPAWRASLLSPAVAIRSGTGGA
jgi:putative ABC transport system permease protein